MFKEHWAQTVFTWQSVLGDDNLVVAAGFTTMMAVFYTYSTAWLLVDVHGSPKFLASRRIQKNRPFSWAKTPHAPAFSTMISNVLCNQFFAILPTLWVLQKVTHGVYVSRSLPALSEVAWQLPATMCLVEILFYTSHRLLHVPWLYRAIHKRHHEYKAPCAFAAVYAHPVEACLGNTVAVIGPAFFLQYHLLTYLVGLALGWVFTCTNHSGYLVIKESHDKHHELFNCEYGTMGILDWWFRTRSSDYLAKRT